MKEFIVKAQKIVNESRFPELPNEVFLLQEEASRKYPNTRVIGTIIKKNPDIYSKLIEHSKRMRPESSISDNIDVYSIINMIGIESISNAFLASILSKIFSATDFDKRVMSHLINTAIISSVLSEDILGLSKSDAYLASILNDIGSIFMIKESDLFLAVYNKSLSNPITSNRDSLKEFGTSSKFISSVLSEKWGIKKIITRSILMLYTKYDQYTINDNARLHVELSKCIEASRYLVAVNHGESYLTAEVKRNGNETLTYLGITNSTIIRAVSMLNRKGVIH